MSDFRTAPIADQDVAAGFTCGVAALDDFFAKYALSNDRRGLGRTFVLRQKAANEPAVLGF